MHGGADAAEALDEEPGLTRIAAEEDALDAADHGYGEAICFTLRAISVLRLADRRLHERVRKLRRAHGKIGSHRAAPAIPVVTS